MIQDRDYLAFLIPNPDMRSDAVVMVKDLNGFTGQAYIHLMADVLVGHRIMIFVHDYVIIILYGCR
jgi:hypothetical protein